MENFEVERHEVKGEMNEQQERLLQNIEGVRERLALLEGLVKEGKIARPSGCDEMTNDLHDFYSRILRFINHETGVPGW